MGKVILECCADETNIYKATLENAKKIVQIKMESIYPDVLEIYADKSNVITKGKILKIINDILRLKDGEMTDDQIQVTEESRQEVVMFCFKNGIPIDDGMIVDSERFFEEFKIPMLSFFVNNESYKKFSKVVCGDLIEMANEYSIIKEDKWDESFSEEDKIKKALLFAEKADLRVVQYNLIEIKDMVK